MAFGDNLHRASWRGVPFALESSHVATGRRKVRHDYPYRDTVWLEDQGKLPRTFRVLGLLVGNSLIYGGGDVVGQIKRMEKTGEISGPGILVHPTRGRISCELTEPLVIVERADEGNVAEVVFVFTVGGTQVFPAILGAFGDLVGKAAGIADGAGLSSFSDKLGQLQAGVGEVTSLAASASEWTDRITGLARDATGLYQTVSQLGGADFGRYFNGRNAGFLAGLVSPFAGASSITDLIGIGSAKRADIASAASVVASTISGLGSGSTSADIGTAVQAHVAALAASAADPADGVRLLGDLAAFGPLSPSAKQPAGSLLSDLYQRTAGAAIARVSATYAPASADDAHAVRTAVLAPIEAAVSRAGATGEDDVFSAFKGLRKAVVQDLADRGADLASLTDLVSPSSLPSLVLAQRQYADAGRADELVTQADPPHPWFMPTLMKALAY